MDLIMNKILFALKNAQLIHILYSVMKEKNVIIMQRNALSQKLNIIIWIWMQKILKNVMIIVNIVMEKEMKQLIIVKNV